MGSRIFEILLGIIGIAGSMKMYKYEWDFRGGAPVSKPVALLFCFMFVVYTIYTVIRKNPTEAQKNELMICSNCKSNYKKLSVSIKVCPRCNGKLVDNEEIENEI